MENIDALIKSQNLLIEMLNKNFNRVERDGKSEEFKRNKAEESIHKGDKKSVYQN